MQIAHLPLASAWVSIAALLMYIWTMMEVGRARGLYQVQPPSMEGPPEFLRRVRVQANTLEQMVIFFPALWLCALAWQDRWAALLGAIWVVGRILYALGYYREAAKRSMGFLISFLASVALILGAGFGLITA